LITIRVLPQVRHTRATIRRIRASEEARSLR
jgi:hypothetical protein